MNKLRTSTKINHLGGLVIICSMRMCAQGATRVCHSGLKRLLCLICFRVLPVEPYDTMGSVLIEYDVRVQP
jgi:hypothetical protein